jgi:hypothetical protein
MLRKMRNGNGSTRSILSCFPGMALALGLAGCQAVPTSTGTTEQAGPQKTGFHFSLSTDGLPKDGKWKSAPLLTDLNHDGLPDIAAHLRLGHGPHAWLGNGKGAWRESSKGLEISQTSCGGGISTDDINRDGHPDLAVADHCQGGFVFLGDGQGNWKNVATAINSSVAREEAKKKSDINVFLGMEDLDLGDVNEDGYSDIVATGSDEGGFTVYFGDGSGRTWTESKYNKADGLPSAEDADAEDGRQGGWAQDLMLTDINGDRHLDVVASYFSGPRVWLGDGKGRWEAAWRGLPHTFVGGIYQRLSIADLNGDGRLDLCVANAVNGVEMFLQKPDGSWQTTPDPFPDMKGGARSVAIGDINGDRHPDLVVGGILTQEPTATRGLFVLLGDGQGHWKEVQDIGLPTSGLGEVYGIALGDVNGDGRLDIVATTDDTAAMEAGTGSNTRRPKLSGVQVWINQR